MTSTRPDDQDDPRWRGDDRDDETPNQADRARRTTESLSPEELRETLSLVGKYRSICQHVKSSSGGSLIFGAIMVALWYFLIPEAQKYKPISLIYLGLGALELCVGFYNRFFPSPEGILFSGLVLLAFTAATALQLIVFQRFSPFQVLAIFWALQGIRHIRDYFSIRASLPLRPTNSDLVYYKELLAAVRSADPVEDPLALDLPTEPPYRAKLLGENAFFTTPAIDELLILPRDFVEIARLPRREGHPPQAELRFLQSPIGTFDLDAENWKNYSAWKGSSIRPEDLSGIERLLRPRDL